MKYSLHSLGELLTPLNRDFISAMSYIGFKLIGILRPHCPNIKLMKGKALSRGGEISKMYTCPRTSGLKKHLSVPMHYLSILLQIQMQVFTK